MTCCNPVVIGATCDDQINYGETIDLEFNYSNENGTPIDLTSATPVIFSSYPSVIKDEGQFTVTDAVNGKARLYLDRINALSLKRGASNRFRLQMVYGPESDDVTPDIYLQVT